MEIGGRVLQSLVDIWHGSEVGEVLAEWPAQQEQDLPGYNLDYVFRAMASRR